MMKRFRLMVLAALLAGSSAMAGENEINEFPFWNNAKFLVDTTNFSAAVPVTGFKPASYAWAIQVVCTNSITNSGNVQLDWQVSNDQATWFVSSNIVTGLSQTNSMEADGKSMYWFTPGMSKFLRLRAIVSETNANLTVNGIIQ